MSMWYEGYLQVAILPSGVYFTDAPLVNWMYRTPSIHCWDEPVVVAMKRSTFPHPVSIVRHTAKTQRPIFMNFLLIK